MQKPCVGHGLLPPVLSEPQDVSWGVGTPRSKASLQIKLPQGGKPFQTAETVKLLLACGIQNVLCSVLQASA